MGRELRMVPADWEHPKKGWQDGYRPLLSGYRKALEEFKEDVKAQGLEDALEYWGGGPYTHNYMPEWAKDEATHYMMYETCTEGTPISPAFATKEELAHWLADTGASAFGKRVASYEAWLNTIEAGYAPSAVLYQVGTR